MVRVGACVDELRLMWSWNFGGGVCPVSRVVEVGGPTMKL